MCSIVAVIASVVFTARMIATNPIERLLFLTPTVFISGIAIKYCHTFLDRPVFANSSLRIASASLRLSSQSRVIAPRQRTPSPGPGNGCLYTISSGRPKAFPQALTSSLNRYFIGSTRVNERSSGRPPTLW